MKKILLLCAIIFTYHSLLTAKSSNYIRGKITGIELKTSNTVTFFIFNAKTLTRSYYADTIYTSEIDQDGIFAIDFNSNDDEFYLSMKFYSGDEEIGISKEFYITPYLCEKGDSVWLNLRLRKEFESGDTYKTIASFSGKGAHKLNCQYLINRYDEPREANGAYLSFMPKNTDGIYLSSQPFEAKENLVLLHQAYKKAIIESYKGLVKDDVLHRIETNMVSGSKYWFAFTNVISGYVMGNSLKRHAVLDYCNNTEAALLSEDNSLTTSLFYPDFILVKLELEYCMKNNIYWANESNHSIPKEVFVKWMFETIKTRYSGILRDRLYVTWFTTNSSHSYLKYQEPLLKKTIDLITQQELKKPLIKLTEQLKGTKAFPFEFIDENDQKHTLGDYKDKIIILDFWFTGCHGCTKIPPVIERIMEKLKDRQDVVYMSISVDKSKETWLKGLNSGLYTLPEQVHLKTISTGGRAEDSFIRNYNITTYPKVMVIGKNAILLSANPTDPRNDLGEHIVSLIQDAK